MPGKTRRKRAKLSGQSKKKSARQTQPAVAIKQPAAAQAQKTIPPSDVSVSPVIEPAPAVKATVIRHPFIVSELRTIGILAVVMLVVLIVLALVLS